MPSRRPVFSPDQLASKSEREAFWAEVRHRDHEQLCMVVMETGRGLAWCYRPVYWAVLGFWSDGSEIRGYCCPQHLVVVCNRAWDELHGGAHWRRGKGHRHPDRVSVHRVDWSPSTRRGPAPFFVEMPAPEEHPPPGAGDAGSST